MLDLTQVLNDVLNDSGTDSLNTDIDFNLL